jgi:hypothetical protein
MSKRARAPNAVRPHVILLHPSSPHLKDETVAAERRHKIII